MFFHKTKNVIFISDKGIFDEVSGEDLADGIAIDFVLHEEDVVGNPA